MEGRAHDIAELVAESDVDAIIHLAALTDAAGNVERRDSVMKNNFEATKRVVDFAQKSACLLVFPSSTSVYGSQATVVDENCAELDPQSPYAESKLLEEAAVRKLAQDDSQAVIFRFGTIYGTSPGMRFHTAVNRFCWQAVTGSPITVWRTALHQVRPYLYLNDAVEAIVWALGGHFQGGETLNVVSKNATVSEVLDVISRFGFEAEVQLVESPIMNQLSYCVDSSLARSRGISLGDDLDVGIGATLKLLGDLRGRRARLH